MNWAFTLLGVAADTDVVAVKRAYARLLRVTRPDENAEAFQRLHTAYQLVLAHANARQTGTVRSTGDATTTPPARPANPAPDDRAPDSTEAMATATSPADQHTGNQPTPAIEQPLAAANPQELASRAIQNTVDTDDERALARWLSAQPEFWSIRIKQQTGQLVLQQLFSTPQPMTPTSLDVLLQFFDLHQVLSGVNPVALAQLRQRQQAMWFLLPENHRALALRLNIPTGRSPDKGVTQALLSLLGTPLRWQRIVWPALHRGRVAATARLIHGLCSGQFDNLPAQIDRRQAEFWYRAAQLAQPSWPRFIVGSVRAMLVGLILLLGVALTCVLSSVLGHAKIDWYAATAIGAIMAGSAVMLWLVYAAWMWLDHWQGLPESTASRHAWLRRGLVPMLCVVGVATDYLLHAPLAATAIVLLTLVLALRRFAHRQPPRRGKRQHFNWARGLPVAGFLVMILAKATSNLQPDLFDQLPLVAIITSATLCFWLADMWRFRFYLTSRTAS